MRNFIPKAFLFGTTAVVVATAAENELEQHSDSKQTFAVHAASAWKEMDAARSGYSLYLKCKPKGRHETGLCVLEKDGERDLGKQAAAGVRGSERKSPDDKPIAVVDSFVDGEAAKKITYISTLNDRPLHVVEVFANHLGTNYSFQLACDPEDVDFVQKDLDAILATLKWKQVAANTTVAPTSLPSSTDRNFDK